MPIPKTAITERALRKLARQATGEAINATSWAKDQGITPQQVSAFLRKEQAAGLKIPRALGYKALTVYVPLDEEEIKSIRKEAKKRRKDSRLTDERPEKTRKR